MTDQNKQYTVEIPAGEAELIEQGAAEQGVSTPDFMVYCVRAFSFGISYAIRMLPKQGQPGPRED
jgi:hypothetical protein